jgi:hypothetical protein
MRKRLKVTDGYQPYVSILHRIVLPERGTKAANLLRKKMVSAAMHQEKVRRSGKGCPHHRCKWCRVKVTLR